MAEPHVVSALVAKRGELAGEVQRYCRELRRLDEQLGHLEAVIRLFAPDYDLASVRPRQRCGGQRRFVPTPGVGGAARCGAVRRHLVDVVIRPRSVPRSTAVTACGCAS